MLLLIGLATAGVPTKLPPDKERGETLYRERCWQCHGASALGDGPLAEALPSPPLAGRIASDDFPDAIAVIQKGQGSMPACSQVLNHHDTRRILVWLAALDSETGIDPDAPAPDDEDEDEDEDEAATPDDAPDEALPAPKGSPKSPPALPLPGAS